MFFGCSLIILYVIIQHYKFC
uniref:Uncharacterized protein n=1 Tax=Arundo donax TaxID=35708 RepID=A0A0A8YH30_ARUDO